MYNENFIVSNINEILEQSTHRDYIESKEWYPKAREVALNFSKEYDLSLIKTSGLISIFSPQKSWEQNIKVTEEYLKSGTCKHFKIQKEKADKLLKLEKPNFEEIENIISGYKTINFFRNIYEPSDYQYVTLDSHMSQIVSGKMDKKFLTKKEYIFVKNIMIKEALKWKVESSHFQAWLWLIWKRIKPKYYDYSKSTNLETQ